MIMIMIIIILYKNTCWRRSQNYTDENTWGAAWLYKATAEDEYLQDAKSRYAHEPAWGFSWDEKTAGNHVSACA